MTYYVYRGRGRRAQYSYPDNWELVSKHEGYEEADREARDLCPKNSEIYTEPGRGLNAAWYGSNSTDTWSAMIELKDIHAKQEAS